MRLTDMGVLMQTLLPVRYTCCTYTTSLTGRCVATKGYLYVYMHAVCNYPFGVCILNGWVCDVWRIYSAGGVNYGEGYAAVARQQASVRTVFHSVFVLRL